MAPARVRTSRSVQFAARILAAFLIVASFRLGQTFFLPIVLSILLSFLLTPFVAAVERIGVPRYPTAAATVLGTLAAALLIGWLVVNETSGLLNNTPRFRENLGLKYSGLVETFQSSLAYVENTLRISHRLRHDTPASSSKAPPPAPARGDPPAPPVAENVFSPIAVLSYLGLALAELIIIILVVAVLSVFLLVHREEARDRLLGLAGESSLLPATQALNDVINGVRRYLLLNLVVNIVFGGAFALILLFLGIPNPLLWAAIAVFSRFVPHLGVYFAIIPPLLVSLSLSAGWLGPLTLIASGIGLDVIVSNFVEPQIYGRGIGVSSIAVVLSALFWTWCWGPVGLFLATPFTVCMAVMGRYVPGLESFSIVFGKETGLRPAYRLYQRLVAGEEAGTRRLLQEYRAEQPSLDVINELVIPALIFVEGDLQQRLISPASYSAILDIVKSTAGESVENRLPGGTGPTIAVHAVRSESETVIAELLAQRLVQKDYQVVFVSDKALSNEAITTFKESGATALVVVAFTHFSSTAVRYLLKRLATTELGIPVVILALGDSSSIARAVKLAPNANAVVLASTLEKVDDALTAFALPSVPQKNAA